jgi:radical SAM superfamily enzyme YgiQ (UPF0313 family)
LYTFVKINIIHAINVTIMRVLLAYTNRYRFMAPPPVGIAYLVRPLLADGHEVKVVDLMFAGDPAAELGNAIDDFKPDIVGFSLRNIDNQNMEETEYFPRRDIEYVRIAKNKKAITVLGGTAFSTFPVRMFDYMGADFGIAGQGERSLPRLLKSLDLGYLDESIPGLVWRDKGKVRANPPDLNGYAASHAGWETIKLAGYASGLFPGAVVTKSGCPYKCAYCNVTSSFGSSFTYRDPADIVEEIKELKASGISGINLVDACFNVPIGYAKDVLKAIAAARLNVRIHTALVPVRGHYDDELFELYKAAGGVLISLGTETFSDKMLMSYGKPFTMDDVRACARLCDKYGVPFMIHALFGGPGESADTIKESMEVLREIHCSEFIYSIGVRLMPGTTLFEAAKKEGVVKDASELFYPRFYVSKDLNVEWADGYIKGKLKEYGLLK